MPQSSVQEITAAAKAASSPSFPPPAPIKLGGVDPLGLRQINFDLMDEMFPGLNNVTRHIRPFTVLAWAWRRAYQLLENEARTEVESDRMLDFVDRIDVIYAWSQFLVLGDAADLPGGRALKPILSSPEYTFGGKRWRAFKTARRNSTALQAPVNYGPALRALELIERHRTLRSVYFASERTRPALDALESRIAPYVAHPAFSKLGSVTVAAADVKSWSKAWALGNPTKPERNLILECLSGPSASSSRRAGVALIRASVILSRSEESSDVRRTMALCKKQTHPMLKATSRLWHYLQVRQLFRLALEGMLDWISLQLSDRPHSTPRLVTTFLAEVPQRLQATTMKEWLSWKSQNINPSDLLDELFDALNSRHSKSIAQAIWRALSFCLTKGSFENFVVERYDRLPLQRAIDEMVMRAQDTPAVAIGHIIDSWVIAQHIYWAVGRGLADARLRGRQILRLRVMLEERGWSLPPGTQPIIPRPTPDRLISAMSLLTECRALATPPQLP
jgi:hypothetical protein